MMASGQDSAIIAVERDREPGGESGNEVRIPIIVPTWPLRRQREQEGDGIYSSGTSAT